MTRLPAGCETGAPIRRPERPADATLLLDLFRAAHDGLFAGLDPALAEVLLRRQSTGQILNYRAAHPAACFDMVEVDGRPVGRIVTEAANAAMRLVDLALFPAWRGRGLGTRLVRTLQAEARAAGVPLRLSVMRSNVGACRLYGRLGFAAEASDGLSVAMRWEP